MHLADLIRKGGAYNNQLEGAIYGPNGPVSGVCALGAAIEGAISEGFIDPEDDDDSKDS